MSASNVKLPEDVKASLGKEPEFNVPAMNDVPMEMVPNSESKFIATSFFDPVAWSQMKGVAEYYIQSKSLPRDIMNAPQLVMRFMMGKDMGMTMMESIGSFYSINGGLSIFGKAVPRQLRKHGWKISYKDESDEQCTAVLTNKETGEEYTDTFKYQDAVDSGYTMDNNKYLKVGWRKGINRKLKMRYNVLSMIIKSYVPEVLGGIAEIKEVAEDYQVIDVPSETSDVAPVEKVLKTISDEDFKKFTANSEQYIIRHKEDYDFTQEQQAALIEALAEKEAAKSEVQNG